MEGVVSWLDRDEINNLLLVNVIVARKFQKLSMKFYICIVYFTTQAFVAKIISATMQQPLFSAK